MKQQPIVYLEYFMYIVGVIIIASQLNHSLLSLVLASIGMALIRVSGGLVDRYNKDNDH